MPLWLIDDKRIIMQTRKYIIDDLNIPRKEIEKILGYGEIELPEPFKSDLDEVYAKANDICDINAAYVIEENINIDLDKGILNVGDKSFSTGKKILRLIKGSEKIILFVCTAGSGLEEWSKKETANGEIMKGYVIDIFASYVVEAAAEKYSREIENIILTQNSKVTNRYSPGYCKWHVSEQETLFSFFPKNPLGIRLSESSLMHPIKSVSGIIGVGDNVKYNPHTCDICESENCLYRNIRKMDKIF